MIENINKKILIALSAIIVIVILAVGFISYESTNDQQTVTASPMDATYLIDGQSVALVNGISEVAAAPGSASKITTRYFGDEATGDLNGDDVPDVGFIITQSAGGSGMFYYAVAALKTTDGYKGTNAILLGDRIAPQTTEIKGGALVVNYADRNSSEPMTSQPSLGVTKHLLVENGSLVEAPVLVADLYPLYSGVGWGPIEATTSPDFGAVALIQSMPFTDITDIASESTPFTQYYHSKLLATGWTEDMSRSAGGPGAEVSVYTKGDQFIVISFHSLFHVQGHDAPAQCPCDVRFTLMNGIQR